ncbi:hypothetical protein XENOCAPTIV_024015 [Xenoophorus captivus]|uniref:Secreted protein n=1 Tax=Xenoophorus captivus TaxID=1517983 RepID=A0ABV0QBE0_9TELE
MGFIRALCLASFRYWVSMVGCGMPAGLDPLLAAFRYCFPVVDEGSRRDLLLYDWRRPIAATFRCWVFFGGWGILAGLGGCLGGLNKLPVGPIPVRGLSSSCGSKLVCLALRRVEAPPGFIRFLELPARSLPGSWTLARSLMWY